MHLWYVITSDLHKVVLAARDDPAIRIGIEVLPGIRIFHFVGCPADNADGHHLDRRNRIVVIATGTHTWECPSVYVQDVPSNASTVVRDDRIAGRYLDRRDAIIGDTFRLHLRKRVVTRV